MSSCPASLCAVGCGPPQEEGPLSVASPTAATQNVQPQLLTVPYECSLQEKEHHTTLATSELEIVVVSALRQAPSLHVASIQASLNLSLFTFQTELSFILGIPMKQVAGKSQRFTKESSRRINVV